MNRKTLKTTLTALIVAITPPITSCNSQNTPKPTTILQQLLGKQTEPEQYTITITPTITEKNLALTITTTNKQQPINPQDIIRSVTIADSTGQLTPTTPEKPTKQTAHYTTPLEKIKGTVEIRVEDTYGRATITIINVQPPHILKKTYPEDYNFYLTQNQENTNLEVIAGRWVTDLQIEGRDTKGNNYRHAWKKQRGIRYTGEKPHGFVSPPMGGTLYLPPTQQPGTYTLTGKDMNGRIKTKTYTITPKPNKKPKLTETTEQNQLDATRIANTKKN